MPRPPHSCLDGLLLCGSGLRHLLPQFSTTATHTHCLPSASAVYSRPQKGGRLTQASLPSSPSAHSPCCAWERAVGSSTSQAGPGCCCCSEQGLTQGKIKATRKGEAAPRHGSRRRPVIRGTPTLCPVPGPAGSPTGWLQESSLGFALQTLAEASRRLQVSQEASSPCLVPSRGVARWQPGPFQPKQHSYRLWSPG